MNYLLIVSLLVQIVVGVRFHVTVGQEFCVADDFKPDELIVGYAKVEPIQPGLRLEMKVRRAKERNIFIEKSIKKL